MSDQLEKTPAQIEAGIRMDRTNLYKKYDHALCRLLERGDVLSLGDKMTLANEVVTAARQLHVVGIVSDVEVQSAEDVLAGLKSELAALKAVHDS